MDNLKIIFNGISINEKKRIFDNACNEQKNALRALSSYIALGELMSENHEEIITNIFSNLNILNRNSVNGETFGQRVINEMSKHKRVFKSWTVSDLLNFAICGLTQLGKTDAIFDCLLNALKSGIFSILASDNSCTQLNQLLHP